ncbi:MAG TPA: hypothetical protein VK524_04920 [Polyangiaceae bacterium]|nr:hypothetical protein [Polyangiaceae bacterium]
MRANLRTSYWAAAAAALLIGCGDVSDSEDSPSEENSGCGLATQWGGDENCIMPPPAELGFQLHYGPSNYDDAAEIQKYLIPSSVDTNIYEPVTAGNTSDIYFYKRQYRMRPGSHHLIVSGEGQGSILGTGRRLGGSQNSIKDNPVGEIPPENRGIGMPLAAGARLILNLHHFNSTPEPLLREAWVNFWYIDAADVKQEAKEIFLWAFGSAIAPSAKATVRGKKTISEAGRILTLYGHRHSNNVRFSAYLNGELVFDDYDWREPAVFEFNTLTNNPTPNLGSGRAGARTGTLELKAGDVLEWECDIENHHAEPITFGENEAITSEMCILVGDAVGPALMGLSEL